MANSLSTIQQHPQLKAIQSKLLAGIPVRRIAAEHKCSYQALGRYKRNVLAKAILQGQSKVPANVSRESIEPIKAIQSNINTLIAAQSTAELLERKWAGIERMKALAEGKSDVGGWASLDRAETAALQLRAQLAGELQPQVAGNVQVAILIPSPAAMQDAGQVIDIDARQGALARDDSGRSDGDNSDD